MLVPPSVAWGELTLSISELEQAADPSSAGVKPYLGCSYHASMRSALAATRRPVTVPRLALQSMQLGPVDADVGSEPEARHATDAALGHALQSRVTAVPRRGF
jgi:hypothetical protein